MSSSALDEGGEPPDLAAYLATELEQSWTDADVVRVRDKLMTTYGSDADEFYALMMHKLEDHRVQMFARMNILFIFDKFCVMSAEREEQRRQAARRNGNGSAHHVEEKDADYERAWSQYRGVYTKMQTDLEKIVFLVLEISAGPEPPNRRPNSNVTWTKKILEGWARRELFPNDVLTAIEARIKDAMDLDWDANDSQAHKYDDEKMDRRMDADRERQKKDKEDFFVQRALPPLSAVSDAWFITMDSTDGHVLDVSEYWATASNPLSEQERERMHRENSKKHFAGRMECYDASLRRRLQPEPQPLTQDGAPPLPLPPQFAPPHPGPAPPPGRYAPSRPTPRQSAESSPHSSYPPPPFRRSGSPPSSYGSSQYPPPLHPSRGRSRSPGYGSSGYPDSQPPQPHYHPGSGYQTPQPVYSRSNSQLQIPPHGPPPYQHSQPQYTHSEPPPAPYSHLQQQQQPRHAPQYRPPPHGGVPHGQPAYGGSGGPPPPPPNSAYHDSSQHSQPPGRPYQHPNYPPRYQSRSGSGTY
ncbi:hypothetical protein HDU87_005666 [Geranomyces variabilis]|uniref:Uncharacterized protein n=1 Tax=Geranomyces variabilis TaxID=109894 RepID=A0AAD5THK7_9FUNG|nr:hypothetical protein HDU87_005666 [Geranomyces variabilis]